MIQHPEHVLWHPDWNQLHICLSDLSDLLNDSRTLALNSFNHVNGISWSLITADGIEHHDDPFERLYFPLPELLDQDSCKAYLDQIPAALLPALKCYRSDCFGMLMLVSRHSFLTELYGKYSTLFWLMFRQAVAEHWTETQFVKRCEAGPLAMLEACHLPTHQTALAILTKITAATFAQRQYDAIVQLFENLDYPLLNELSEIPDSLVQFLLKHPTLQALQIWRSSHIHDYDQVRSSVEAIQRFASQLEIDTVNVSLLVNTASDLPALKSLENRLRAQLLAAELCDYENKLIDAQHAARTFPRLSLLADRDELRQILSETELLTESRIFQHNFMPYVDGISKGQYAVYKIIKPEMALLLLMLFPKRDGGIQPVIKTLVTYHGKMVDNGTLQFVKACLNEQSKHTGPHSQFTA